MQRAWLWWSSGKDSAWTLHELRSRPGIEVTGLIVTFNELFDRVTMHGVRRELVERQIRSTGLPLRAMTIPHRATNEQYESAVRSLLAAAKADGVTAMAFGDLYLEDVRAYREKLLESSGIAALFPLWGRDTRQLIHAMLDGGLRAYVTCVDPKLLSARFVGRELDRAFLEELPADVDPCGEGGEFHTFAYDGPMFRKPVEVRVGEIVEREGFVFADLR